MVPALVARPEVKNTVLPEPAAIVPATFCVTQPPSASVPCASIRPLLMIALAIDPSPWIRPVLVIVPPVSPRHLPRGLFRSS
jgi:hypothetical protein